MDLISGGWPCQDVSVAGKRAGLAGSRSGLFHEMTRIVKEMRDATGNTRPAFVMGENVPGLLSSNGGRDFAAVLHGLAQCGCLGIQWRILDARFFNVPQRRRRVFLVGYLGAPCPPAVLLEPEGMRGDLAAGGEAGAGLAGTLGGGAGKRGWCSDIERMTFVPYSIHPDATHRTGDGAYRQPGLGIRQDGTSYTMDADRPPVVAFDHTQDPVSSFSVGTTLNEDGQAVAYGIKTSQTGANGANLWREYTHGIQTSEPPPAVQQAGAAVRRLTPTECERLQAFPDGHTCLCGIEPYSTWTCRCPDGPRYAALGNAVTVNVIEWLGRRLLTALTCAS